MATQPLEQELMSLERRYCQALEDKDLDAAIALADDPCLIVGAQGVQSIDPKTFREMMTGAPYELVSFELTGAQVRMLRDDVAVLAYSVHEELMVGGKPWRLDANDASTWVKKDGRWVCAMHTESLRGDPFGRDKVHAEKP